MKRILLAAAAALTAAAWFAIPGGAQVPRVRPPAFKVDVRDYGATLNDAVDDVGAITRAIDAAGEGGTVLFPAGKYRLASGLTLTKRGQTWIMDGAYFEVAFNGVGLTVGSVAERLSHVTLQGGTWRYYNVTAGAALSNANSILLDLDPYPVSSTWPEGWTSGNVGVKCINIEGFQWAGFTIAGFETGLSLLGDGNGCQLNTFTPKRFFSNKTHVKLYSQNGGFCNGNTFQGATHYHMQDSDPDATGGYAIHLDSAVGGNAIASNFFYGPYIETAIVLAGMPNSLIYANCAESTFICTLEVLPQTITGVSVASNDVTCTLAANTGDAPAINTNVYVYNVTGLTAGWYFVTARPSDTSFTFTKKATDTVSGTTGNFRRGAINGSGSLFTSGRNYFQITGPVGAADGEISTASNADFARNYKGLFPFGTHLGGSGANGKLLTIQDTNAVFNKTVVFRPSTGSGDPGDTLDSIWGGFYSAGAFKNYRNVTGQRVTSPESGTQMLDTTLGNLIYSDGTNWHVVQQAQSGATGSRPANPTAGEHYLDTTLGQDVVYNGTAWRALGLSSSGAVGSRPASPIAGETYWNTTYAAMETYDGANWIFASPVCIFTAAQNAASGSQGSDGTLVNATGALGSKTLPAGMLNLAGRTLHVCVRGYFQTDNDGGITDLKIKLGSTTIASTGGTKLDSDAVDFGWELDAYVRCHTTGGAGVGQVHTEGKVLVFANNTPVVPQASAVQAHQLFNAASAHGNLVTVDLTAAQTIDVTSNWTDATGCIIRGTLVSYEILR